MRQENDGFVDLLRNYFLAKQLKLSFSVMIVSSSTICCCFETIATCLLLPRGGQKQIDMFWKEVSKEYFFAKSKILCWKELFCLYVWFKNICYSKGSGASSINDLGNKFIKYEFLFKYDIDVFKIRLSNLHLFKNILTYCKCTISTRWYQLFSAISWPNFTQ